MKEGKVKWYNPLKGYGFITPLDEDYEVFFHHSTFTEEFEVNKGGKIWFESEIGEKGFRAKRVAPKDILEYPSG